MASSVLAMNERKIMFGRVFHYVMAPFYPSTWQKSAPDKSGLTPEKVRQALLKACIYYLIFSPLIAMPFYNNCIFHPFMTGNYAVSQIAGVKKQDVFFQNASGTRLHGWYFAKPGAKKTVLLSHGNAGNITHRQDLCTLLLSAGASVFIYDYSGFGLSRGSATIDGCCQDATAAFDYLTNTLKVPANQIVLYGESVGTGFTCQLAARRPCAAVILQSAFQSLPQIAYEKMPLICIYPRFLYPVNPLDSLSYVRGQHPPLLLIHGKQDKLISCGNSQNLFDAASGEKYLFTLPNAGHNDVPYNQTDECLVALSRFLH